MSIIAKLPGMSLSELDSLHKNAQRIIDGGGAKMNEAQRVMDAVIAEKMTRKASEEEASSKALDEVRKATAHLALRDRVVMAFTDMPAAEWEIDILRAVASNPGCDYDTIVASIGKSEGSYLNLAFGKICAAREHYLGEAPPSTKRPGEKNYSMLLVDFTKHADGRDWHGWTMKPDAEAGLKDVGIL